MIASARTLPASIRERASGIEHGFEVIRNAVFDKRTNPFLIREFMSAADLSGHSLCPEYRFTF